MGVSAAVFTSAGQRSEHYIPGGYSRRNYVPNAGGGVSSGNVCILGESRAGEPHKLLVFGSANDARATLESGTGLEGVIKAFNPGGGLVPQQIGFMRVNKGTQSTRTLVKTAADVFSVKSFNYGVPMNQIKMRFYAGTVSGSHRLDTEYKGSTFVHDNIERKSFTIQYTGAGSAAALTITGTTLATTVTGASGEDLSITLSSFPTISELVEYINDNAVYTATVLTTDATELTSQLDAISAIDIKTAVYNVKSDLQAILEAFESSVLLSTVTLISATRIIPDYDSAWVYLSGATDGAYTTTEWSDALEVLLGEDIQFIATPVTTEATHVLIKNHCDTANGVEGKAERQFYVGGALAEDVSAVSTRALNLNSEYGSLCSPGFYDYNDSGVKTLYAPSYYACKQVGALSALNLNNPTTWKTISVLGWEKDYKRTELNTLIQAGVLCGGKRPDGSYITVRSITTYQGSLLQKNEASMMRESLYMNRDLRTAIETAVTGTPLIGNEQLAVIDAIFARKINEWYTSGLIVKGPDQPNLYWGYTRRISGDQIFIEYNTYDTAPTNFTFTTSNHNVLVTTAQVA
jgi:hypothetical protein